MIVFDAGGTLIGADWPRVTRDLAAVARDHRLDVDGVSVMTGLGQVWQDFIDGRVEDRANSRTAVTAFWNEMLARTLSLAADLSLPTDGESYDPRAWDAACAFYPAFDAGAYHRLIDGAEETLAALGAAGYRLAMLSNWSPRLPRVLQRLNIRHYFEFVVVSALVGVAKPDRAIFDLAVRMSGCRPEELLYVGDSPAADINGSRAAGWDAVLITTRHPDADVPLKVGSLAELPGFLAALPGRGSEIQAR
jgi:HAD superfamily hydrolase (TIGR01549 family)